MFLILWCMQCSPGQGQIRMLGQNTTRPLAVYKALAGEFEPWWFIYIDANWSHETILDDALSLSLLIRASEPTDATSHSEADGVVAVGGVWGLGYVCMFSGASLEIDADAQELTISGEVPLDECINTLGKGWTSSSRIELQRLRVPRDNILEVEIRIEGKYGIEWNLAADTRGWMDAWVNALQRDYDRRRGISSGGQGKGRHD